MNQLSEITIDIKQFRVQVESDIHLEMHLHPPRLSVAAEVLCLCGDIGYPSHPSYRKFLVSCSMLFRWVFLIAGNHEYYHNTSPISETAALIAEIVSEIPNMTFLDNTSVVVNYGERQIRVFGTTLWSDTSESGDICDYINDYHKIHINCDGENKLVTTDAITSLHIEARRSLQVETKRSDMPMIVMSHHLPSRKCVHPRYLTSEYDIPNCAYASNSDDLITSPIICWVFGHSHYCTDSNINGIRVVSNPMGYPGQFTGPYNSYFSANITKMLSGELPGK